jgi:hypothetical protein
MLEYNYCYIVFYLSVFEVRFAPLYSFILRNLSSIRTGHVVGSVPCPPNTFRRKQEMSCSYETIKTHFALSKNLPLTSAFRNWANIQRTISYRLGPGLAKDKPTLLFLSFCKVSKVEYFCMVCLRDCLFGVSLQSLNANQFQICVRIPISSLDQSEAGIAL